MAGAIYYIQGESMPWLMPLLEISGIFLQLIACAKKYKFLLALATPIVIIPAALQRDIVLFIGDGLAAICLYMILKK